MQKAVSLRNMVSVVLGFIALILGYILFFDRDILIPKVAAAACHLPQNGTESAGPEELYVVGCSGLL